VGIFDFLKDIPLSAVLREKLKDVEAEVAKLRTESQTLREQLESKTKEATALTDQVQVLTERLVPTGASKLHEIEERLLLMLADHDELREDVAAQLAQAGRQVVVYHFEELRRRNFVHASHYAGSDWSGDAPRTEWSLGHVGREYLIRRGLLK
jgi:regulator of replication initiation timing